ncbi:hypothetical protein HELRODRAFT_174308 [Helobdella robusta]|uniref:Uncharacterized protein n=1 Tax=Helobdella robusta TaxID=6412 RepID=T1F7Z4_HELRO|nr:hypothetical protein HELRODRAFT_174308 [Helobdella robusta]ESO02871.1 hypothetical protein HELRODRAFT_174308 [Helobdella robusta]
MKRQKERTTRKKTKHRELELCSTIENLEPTDKRTLDYHWKLQHGVGDIANIEAITSVLVVRGRGGCNTGVRNGIFRRLHSADRSKVLIARNVKTSNLCGHIMLR